MFNLTGCKAANLVRAAERVGATLPQSGWRMVLLSFAIPSPALDAFNLALADWKAEGEPDRADALNKMRRPS